LTKVLYNVLIGFVTGPPKELFWLDKLKYVRTKVKLKRLS